MVERKRRRKTETDAVLPHFMEIRSEAHLRFNLLARVRSDRQKWDGQVPLPAGLTEELARRQLGVEVLFRIGDLALQGLETSAFVDEVLKLVVQSIKGDAALVLLRDEHGGFSSSQQGEAAIVTRLLSMLQRSFEGLSEDLTEETIQSRARGVTLMALSNKFGWLVLATGNKSEMATGFSTIYGDMVGGFAVIKDVTKTRVYELCRERNRRSPVIPEAVLSKAPSAELRPGQRDDQSLPPYDELDPILLAYVEDDMTAGELVQAGFDAGLVRRVVTLVDRAEYKRRQAPPGVRVTPKAFGKDRRLPITNRYTG